MALFMDMLNKNITHPYNRPATQLTPRDLPFLRKPCHFKFRQAEALVVRVRTNIGFMSKIHLKVRYVNLIANGPLKGFLIFSSQRTTTQPVSTRLISCRTPRAHK